MWPRFRASWSRDVAHPRRLKMRRLPRRSGIGSPVGVFCFFAGSRDALSCFMRCPLRGGAYFSLPPQHASLFGVFAFAFAGIRELLARFTRRPCAGRNLLFFAAATCIVVWRFGICFRWHPRIVSSLHASPLCGAAPTFLCRRKEK